jgi:two-component system nitrate/nitrite response regulator NarL
MNRLMKLLVVDDHPVMRDGLTALLKQVGPDTQVLQARDAAEAFSLCASHTDLDLVVMDLVMPGMDGLTALTEFGRRHPGLPIIVLSSSEDPQDARRALAQGALGYVPKSASQHTLISAIGLVMEGEIYVPPLIMSVIGGETKLPARLPASNPGEYDLTERQLDVLRLLAEGHANKIIAYRLDLKEKTVKFHVSAIFRVLHVTNRTQAAAAARAKGLV